jgi:hypothetical protein
MQRNAEAKGPLGCRWPPGEEVRKVPQRRAATARIPLTKVGLWASRRQVGRPASEPFAMGKSIMGVLGQEPGSNPTAATKI